MVACAAPGGHTVAVGGGQASGVIVDVEVVVTVAVEVEPGSRTVAVDVIVLVSPTVTAGTTLVVVWVVVTVFLPTVVVTVVGTPPDSVTV